ncbi:MAG: SDR family NAD(P)-dependent oxidoreductase, partial [Cyclobacteriaceae bacterium]|nr:SDR family NAD(P)-dependent oxidoreductase [Cyclobacteriaceae bacterium]
MSKQKWTTDNIPDLTGKVIIVTGGNSGLGYESVKAFAEKGAEVILACRSIEKGDAAKLEIMQGNPTGTITIMQLDLMDLASIKNFASDYKLKYNQLDVLLNNAGIMTTPYGLTKDGFESQTGTNHLGHFALTGLLLDLIIKTSESRMVNVSSMAHKQGKMDFENLLYEGGKGYSRMGAYGRSKLANLLFTYELQRLFIANNIDSIVVAAHPGGSQTNLARHIEGKWWFKMLRPLIELLMQDQAQGTLPQIRASVDPNVKSGEYYGPDGFNEMTGLPILVKSNKASHSQEDARKLWEVSEEL